MIVANTIAEVRAWHPVGKSVGFVPTMGALHEGHLSLIRRAKAENDFVAVSIFVNPTQFNDPADFEKYPRTLQTDSALVDSAGVDLIFSPTPREMYPNGFDTSVKVNALSAKLEGEFRPGHFDGVSIVVSKLLNIVAPTRAYFGEKDYQQLQIVRRMVQDLNMQIEIVPCPIIREADGLAMSSRNSRLTPEERRAALVLSRALASAQEIADTGIHDAYRLAAWVAQTIAAEPLAKLDYALIVDPEELREIDTIDSGAIALVAAYFGDVRLIDNRILIPAPGTVVYR
jgi:pantoate--beta-alanine ligase